MFENNNNMGMYNNGIPQGTGYNFMGMQPQQVNAKINNALTNEEIQKLMQKENQFTLQVTETEHLRAICTHRTPDGLNDTIVEEPDGTCRCYICGYVFNPLDPNTSPEVLNDSVANMIDILQTIKLLYINMPAEVAREYYNIIPLIEKVPKLFEYACKDYAKHANVNAYNYNARNMSTMNLFNMVMGGMNNMGMPQYQPQQQMMGGYAQQQPYYGANVSGMYPQQNMMTNGFGYNSNVPMNNGAPTGGYQPATNGYQYTPTQPVTPAQSQTPVNIQNPPAVPGTTAATETTATTDGKDVNVTSTFKA